LVFFVRRCLAIPLKISSIRQGKAVNGSYFAGMADKLLDLLLAVAKLLVRGDNAYGEWIQ
jgi:hypothetical protein